MLEQHELSAISVFEREPRSSDSSRWAKHVIDQREYTFVQPITFTPYASVKACSARCQFCSENLREVNARLHASQLRPKENYFDMLDEVLSKLKGLPLSYSLSGLEMTDDFNWFISLLDRLAMFRDASPVENSVLYTNMSGFCDNKNGLKTIQAVDDFRLDWIEVSRHHFDGAINQNIMRFRPECEAIDNVAFSSTLGLLAEVTPVKLVCILQRGGVDSVNGLLGYLYWAKRLGVKKVIFRELSILNAMYKTNSTYSYIESSRVSVVALFDEFLKDKRIEGNIEWTLSTKGYYFNNIVGLYDDIELVFEVSDYSLMHEKHNSERVYKLIFHSNGNLCADWNPVNNILYQANNNGSDL